MTANRWLAGSAFVFGVGAWIAPTPKAPSASVMTDQTVSMTQTQESGAARIVTGSYAGPEGTRGWRLAIPSVHEPAAPRPMLVMLHGCLQDAADIARGTRFDEVAEAEGILVLYPEQPASANPRKCWNWFDQAHQQRDAGEPALLAALIARVGADHGADPARVHLAGVSAGAAMATLLAVAYPERFQSLSSMAGIGWASAPSVMAALAVMQHGAGDSLPTPARMIETMGARARAMPVLIVHGAADQVVSMRNANELARQFVGLHDALRAQRNGSSLVPRDPVERRENGYAVREQSWTDPEGRALVTVLRVEELGHAWPAGAPEGSFTDRQGPELSRRIGAAVARPPRAP